MTYLGLVLDICQILFNILTVLCVMYDVVLFLSVIKHRFFSTAANKTPFVYITVMTFTGVIGKFADFFMVDAWPIGDWIDPVNGYQAYRKILGKQMTLIATFCYLTEIFINWLMTIHRVSILLSPGRAPAWFTDSKLAVYCSTIMTGILITLLIPYYSPCYVNFNALTSLHETGCAPNKHMLTRFQNLYLIWVPVSAVMINSTMIFYIKFSRKFIQRSTVLSAATVQRENLMIKQACFIATYLSFFEVGYLFMRFYPEYFSSLPREVQSITYQLRLLAICSLNFFVYFVQTKSTKHILLKYLGFKPSNKAVTPVSMSQTRKI